MFKFGWSRWDAFVKLGEALTRVAERAELRRIRQEDEARQLRLGDLEGQTMRAMALADALSGSVLVEVADPATVKPSRWPFN